MKSVFGSKTFWFNILGMVATVALPQAQDAVSQHPAITGAIMTGANLALRFVTSQPISFNPNKPPYLQ